MSEPFGQLAMQVLPKGLYARALLHSRRYGEATSVLLAAVGEHAGLARVAGELLRHKCFAGDWRDSAGLLALARAGFAAGDHAHMPYLEIARGHDRGAIRRIGETIAARWAQPAIMRPPRPAGARIRVAYLSADFNPHATTNLLSELPELHRRELFEVFAFSYGEDSDDAVRHRLRDGFEHFIEVAGETDAAIADRIAACGIDIAVDLKGLTEHARPGILAARPAPVQVAWLGYPATSGMEWIDYIIADRIVLPAAHFADYSEQIVWLPDTYQVNDRQRPVGAAGTRAEHGLPAEGLIFASFNNGYKITPAMFDIWMRLLTLVPGSVLWQLDSHPDLASNLRREAAARAVDPARLVFAPSVDRPEYIGRMVLADLFLDTVPCNAHTTASDALWAGLPVLTMRGETFTGRVAASLLAAVDLPELVAGDVGEYEAKALQLARAPDRLAALRARLDAGRTTCRLFDTPRFRNGIETAFDTMLTRHRAGLPPAHFAVESPRTK